MNVPLRIIHAIGLLVMSTAQAISTEPTAVLRVETDPARAGISVLSWDTEGGIRAQLNLLRKQTAVSLRIKMSDRWRAGEAFQTNVDNRDAGETRFRLI